MARPVRHAIVADLHGKRGAWRRVSAAAARAGADRIVGLGDYLECKVPNRRHDPSRRWELGDVVKVDERLWRSLAGADLILGNQESRIRDLLRPDQLPDALAPLLAAPERRHVGSARCEHGHRLTWEPDAGGTLLPVLGAGFPEPLMLVGHTHQVLLLEVMPPLESAPGPGGQPRPGPGAPRLRRLPVPVGAPVGLLPAGHVFANVGQARGHPSHWLLYDDDREELRYLEVDD